MNNNNNNNSSRPTDWLKIRPLESCQTSYLVVYFYPSQFFGEWCPFTSRRQCTVIVCCFDKSPHQVVSQPAEILSSTAVSSLNHENKCATIIKPAKVQYSLFKWMMMIYQQFLFFDWLEATGFPHICSRLIGFLRAVVRRRNGKFSKNRIISEKWKQNNRIHRAV